MRPRNGGSRFMGEFEDLYFLSDFIYATRAFA